MDDERILGSHGAQCNLCHMEERVHSRIDPPRHGLDPKDLDSIWEILRDADGQFIPPLSARTSSVQSDLIVSELDPDGPREYFDSMRTQYFLIARGTKGRAVGFMSFRKNYRLPEEASAPPGLYYYVSTVIIERAHRRQGLTREMYELLLENADHHGHGVATRTWSTNAGHLALLEQLGIDVVHTIPDGRGRGVDTLYLARPPRREAADDGA